MTGVTIVVPVMNGAASLRSTLDALWAQIGDRPAEFIVVDDGSTDGSVDLVRQIAGDRAVTILRGAGRGAAAALNAGIRRARHPVICQVDQDVVPGPDWIERLLAALAEPDIAAAQGRYVSDRHASLFARVMGLDLDLRYASVPLDTDHVCTGNTAYRTAALRHAGLFDESLGYGYDNDISYRLRAAGYRLVFCREATSAHRWREGLRGYFWQQYGFGYGRMDVVAKHPTRVSGDRVSPTLMMLHPLAALLALLCVGIWGAAADPVATVALATASIITISLLLERLTAGVRASVRFGDAAALWFPIVHLVRDLAWVCAMLAWVTHRLGGDVATPARSMRPRAGGAVSPKDYFGVTDGHDGAAARVLAVIPARNESGNLPFVIDGLRTARPALEILVIDDASTDDTADVAAARGVRWIVLPEPMGVGTATRAGLRYASRNGFDFAVRVDGDGQHRPEDLDAVLEPVMSGRADVSFGCRAEPHRSGWSPLGIVKRTLARCLSILARRKVADPTSGFYAMGPRAMRMLADRHPSGYPEPELRLLLARTSLRSLDVTIGSRPRLHGRTSLTPRRVVAAAARVAMALCIVPLRPMESDRAD